MVGLDKHGLEAAAATAVVMGRTSEQEVDNVIRADRPFFFAVVDKPTKTILFAGHVTNPKD
jgi:serpin B